MMMKIVSLLMKNKARQSLNTIKNFWWYAIGLIAAGIVCLYFCAYGYHNFAQRMPFALG